MESDKEDDAEYTVEETQNFVNTDKSIRVSNIVMADEKQGKDDKTKEETSSHGQPPKYSAVVPDGGWGWLVAIGGFIITMLITSLGPCFGILFSRYLLEMGASSVMTAWIFNVQLFIWHLMGPLVRPLSAEFGWRPIGLVGVLLCSASIIVSAFSPSAGFLFFSFSLLSGVGGGLVVSMCYIIIPQYFDHRRGLANAIMMVGLCMGQILGAPFIRYLQDSQGFLGSTLIFGAIMLNGCIGVAFFHPVEWHVRKVKVEEEQMLSEQTSDDTTVSKRSKMENGNSVGRLYSGEVYSDDSYKERVVTDDNTTSGETNVINGRRSMSDTNAHKSVAQNSGLPHGKDSSPMHHTDKKMNDIKRERYSNNKALKLAMILVRVARSTITDLKILRARRALIIALGNTLCMNAYFNFIMMVPFALQAANFTLQDSAWCITVMGIFNLLFRIILSVLSDWPRFDMRLCCMAGYAVLGAVMFVFPLLRELKWLVTAMGVFGCGLAATISLLHLAMIRYMGMENLAAVFGSTCLLIGFGFPTIGPFIGFIRDFSGSYAVSMWVLSAMNFTAFLLWLFMPYAESCDNKDKLQNVTDKTRESTSVA